MYRIVQNLSRFFTRIVAGGASFSMLIVFSIVFFNSVRRYTVGKSYEWGEQLPVFIAIYGLLFGVAWAYMQDRHIRFTLLVGFLPESLTRKLYMLVDIIMVATGGLLTYSGYLFVLKRGGMEASGLISSAKQLKAATGWGDMIWIGHFYPYQSAMIIGGALLTIAAILRFLMRLSETTAPETSEVQ